VADVNQRVQLQQVEHLRSQDSRSATSQIDNNLTDVSPSFFAHVMTWNRRWVAEDAIGAVNVFH